MNILPLCFGAGQPFPKMPTPISISFTYNTKILLSAGFTLTGYNTPLNAPNVEALENSFLLPRKHTAPPKNGGKVQDRRV